MDRGEARHRLLKDHGDVAAADVPNLRADGVEFGHVDAAFVPVKQDLSGLDTPRLGNDSHDRLGGDALAAARLADDAQRLLLADVEADAVHRLEHALFEIKVGANVADVE